MLEGAWLDQRLVPAAVEIVAACALPAYHLDRSHGGVEGVGEVLVLGTSS
jgi:hypothetical protein